MIGSSKSVVAAVMSGFAALGMTPTEVSQAKAIMIGLVVGLAIRWVQDKNEEERLKLPAGRRFELFVWIALAGTAAYAAEGWWDLNNKVLPFVTAVLAFSIRAWVGAIEKRGLKEIAEGIIPSIAQKEVKPKPNPNQNQNQNPEDTNA
jgi:uncharacterized membrane protein YeiH